MLTYITSMDPGSPAEKNLNWPALLRTLGSHEEKFELYKWWGQMKCHLQNTQFKEVMYLEWTTSTNRGFTNVTTEEKTITAVSKSNLMEAMIENTRMMF